MNRFKNKLTPDSALVLNRKEAPELNSQFLIK